MGFLKTLARIVASPLFIGLTITLMFAGIAFLFYADKEESSGFFHVLHQVHERSLDARLKARGLRTGSNDVAVLAIDEKAVETVGRWPWSRDKIAHVVNEAVRLGAKVVAFDIVFSEPDSNSAQPTLERLKSELSRQKLASPSLVRLLDKEIELADTDEKLALTVAHQKSKLVMGAYFDEIELPLTPAQELCWDVAYQKTNTYQKWSHEASSPLVNDTEAVELPPSFVQAIDSHLHELSLKGVQEWAQTNHQSLLEAKRYLESELKREVDPTEFASVLLAWFEKDSDTLKELLKSNSTNFVLNLSRRLDTLKRDSLNLKIESLARSYCSRFLTPEDELQETFKKAANDLHAIQPGWQSLNAEQTLAAFKESVLRNPIHPTGRFWLNIPSLVGASEANGYFNAHLDSDAAVRSSWLIARTGNQYVNSIAMKSYLQGLGANLLVTLERNFNLPGTKKVSEFKVLDAEGETISQIPVDPTGRMVINYAGPRYMYPHVSMADLMNTAPTIRVLQRVKSDGKWKISEEDVPKTEFFKDKYLLAGATATGIYDLRVTPFEENYPGVETHANVLDNLLRQDFLRVHPDEEIYMPLFLLGLGIVLSLTLAHLGALAGFVVASLSLVGVYYVDKFVFFKQGVIISVILPLLLILSLYLFLTFYKYLTEERKKKELKGTFEKYVSPAIVQEILADPRHLELGGRKEMITVFFSDVRGFTTISEKLDPRALSDLLNSYLTPMTELVFEHKGTLDKYMGDAIMAFFGAPIHYEDHAKYASRCALAHLTKLRELQAEYERKGLPSIDIGIGLNTGEMSVGNMGSNIVRSYTVMGDAVNLGSRLEGINKTYGTRIIISEFTQSLITPDFVTREIDWVRVKGKAQPVKIFELIAEAKAPEDVTEMLKWFKEGYEFYHEKNWAKGMASFNQALNLKPNDGCSQLYLQRCTEFLKEPPPADWDGVFVMKTK